MTTQNALTVTSSTSGVAISSAGPDVYSRISDPLAAVERLGEMIAQSGLFGCTKVEQGQVLALQCMSERMPPLEMAKTYHMISGKLSMRSDAMLGKYQMSGGKVTWKVRNDKEVTAVFSHRGNELSFTAKMDEFVASGVATDGRGQLKDNWKKFPRQMLTARVISEAVRLLAPEIVFGIYTPEEVQDFADKPAPVVEREEPKPVVATVQEAPASPTNDRLAEIIGDREKEVNAFLIARDYVPVGKTWRDLSASLAERIVASPKAFLEAVNARSS